MFRDTDLSVNYRRAGWVIWLGLAIAVSIAVIVSIAAGRERSVMPAYQSAVENWFAGRPLYNMHGSGFLYLPQAALTFAPWALLPHTASELTWRWFIIGVLAASVAQLNRRLEGDGKSFFVVSIVTAVLAWGCARNGQSTLVITGLMILASIDLSQQKWWRATILLSLAFAFKPLAVVLMLLAVVIYPQISWRVAIGMIVVALAPFVTQRPEYVLSQYRDCLQSLQVTFHVGDAEKWAQLFSMLEVGGLNIPSPYRTSLRLLAAVLTLAACWKACRTLSPQRSFFYLYSLACCYLMLFNSRTEGSTYAMVGPAYGVLLAEAAYQLKNRTIVSWMIAAVTLSVLNFDLAILISRREDAVWISPLVCLCVTSYLVWRLFEEMRRIKQNDNRSLNPVETSLNTIEQRIAA